MTVNYIYDSNGAIEYAIIPYSVWKKLKQSITIKKIEKFKDDEKDFNPSEYRGLLSHLNLDIEKELKNMKDQWNTNI
ncbi:MAG: hypothetical protein H8D45_21445 [Bacteroidetes bacterium]|nr:hypothetical protein [Bacteroidota bacterium]MBL7104955.1 hypothetical protein [Bacteroidales bacterium]